MNGGAWLTTLVLTCVGCTKKSDCSDQSSTAKTLPSVRVPEALPSAFGVELNASPPGSLRFIAIGGGPTPESTEVSLEQDIELVAKTLPQPGAVLFAGGKGSLTVREIDAEQRGDAVLVALGELWSSRPGRRSHYRAVHLEADHATPEAIDTRLKSELGAGSSPLLVYIAAHGDQGISPGGNAVALWGGQTLTVSRFAALTEETSRPLRLVATSCFSGGFAEIVFARAEERNGPSKTVRCGLFAGTWDRETSGCDANPDRRAQESYGVHFTQALGGRDRSGHPLPLEDVDYDHDGRVSLLDAHTRATIAAASLDVPTRTSERWVRAMESGSAAIDRKVLPEDAAVVTALSVALHLPDEQAAERRWKEIDERLESLTHELDDADSELTKRESALTSRLLERWPALNDAFHPDFAETLRKDRTAIQNVLEHSDESRTLEQAKEKANGIDAQIADLEVDEARVLRLRRAYETMHKAAALLRRGGPAAERFRALLACERSAP